MQQLDPLRQKQTRLSQAVENVKATKSDVEVQGQSVARQIESSFDELHKVLEDRKHELLLEAGGKVAQKLEHLSSQEKGLSIACAMVQSVIDYTEQCVEYSADDEIMTAHAEIQSQINREIEEQQKEGKNLKPVEEADMEVQVCCANDLKEFCHSNTKLVELPIECFIEQGIKSAEVDKASEFRVFTKLSTSRRCTISCTLKTLATGSKSKCAVEHINDSEYRIQYTPTVRGRHELSVTADGKNIEGSPFPVVVSISPTHLGKPIRVIKTGCVFGIAVTTAGQMHVVGWEGYKVLSKTGEKLKHINKEDLGMYNIRGVCIESESGGVYIAGQTAFSSKGKIVKLNSKYQVLHQFTQDQSWFWGIVLVKENVLVCDYEKSCIIVFSRKLQYLREISGPDKQPFSHYFSLDKHGNLYAGNREQCCILVLSQDGQLIRSFGHDSKGVEILRVPQGVCVSGDYVYATDKVNHRVSALTTAGEHVTTFGQKGEKEGEFNDPWGVCVDEDLFVYVCDVYNNRIQIF